MCLKLASPGTAFVLLVWVPVAWSQSPRDANDAARPPEKVTRLADAYVREYQAAFPEIAFLSGFTLTRNDGLSDNSLTGIAAWQQKEDRWWKEASAIDPVPLWGKPEWITHGFLLEALQNSRNARVCRGELWPVSQLFGWQAMFSRLADIQPVGSEENRAQALARWRKLPGYLEIETANLREGVKLGYTTPRHNVGLAIEQLERILELPVAESPFYGPARRDSTAGFRSAWETLLIREINPAITRYVANLRTDYLPKARTDIAISAQPMGANCYQASFRAFTSLDRPPRETFSRGEAQVAEYEIEMARIGRDDLGTDDVAALRQRVDTDTANRFHSREELLAFSQAAVARAKSVLPKWFGRLPNADAVVQPHPDFFGADASDRYSAPAQDGSRPGVFLINLYQPEKKLRSKAEVTAFHESEAPRTSSSIPMPVSSSRCS